MNSDEKKLLLLFLSVIFHYHGLDEEERGILEDKAKKIDGTSELKWANDFISRDYFTAFDRARDYLNREMVKLDENLRIEFMGEVWKSNNNKGYITEMEATAMIRLAKDWKIDRKFIQLIRHL